MSKSGSKVVGLIIVIIIVVVAIVLWSSKGYNVRQNNTGGTNNGANNANNSNSNAGIMAPDTAKILASLKKAQISIPEMDAKVTLTDGQADFSVVGTPVTGYVVLGDNISTSEGLPILATLGVNGGGTGVFEYLVLFDVDFNHTSSIFIGDRVKIESISITRTGTSTMAEVKYLDRNVDDPFAENPTVPHTMTVPVFDSKFAADKKTVQ